MLVLPDGQAHLSLDLLSDLIHRSHEQLPEQKTRTAHALSVLFRLWVEEPEHHLEEGAPVVERALTTKATQHYGIQICIIPFVPTFQYTSRGSLFCENNGPLTFH